MLSESSRPIAVWGERNGWARSSSTGLRKVGPAFVKTRHRGCFDPAVGGRDKARGSRLPNDARSV